MKHLSLFVLVVSSFLRLAAGGDAAKRDFEADAIGQPPAAFEFARTGGGAEGKWVVRTEKGADSNRVFDGTYDTFKEAGKVGLWTKADSVIEFDDFTVEGRD
jgi:hypothetical protein